MEALRQFFLAAMGTLSFAVLFHVQPKFYLRCAVDGGVGWLVYWALKALGASSMVATLAASVPLTLLARFFSVRAKAPVTVFLLCGIFPLVPGAGIYYAAYHFIQGQTALLGMQLMEVFKVAVALALGISAVLSIPLPHSRVYGPRGEVSGEKE